MNQDQKLIKILSYKEKYSKERILLEHLGQQLKRGVLSRKLQKLIKKL